MDDALYRQQGMTVSDRLQLPQNKFYSSISAPPVVLTLPIWDSPSAGSLGTFVFGTAFTQELRAHSVSSGPITQFILTGGALPLGIILDHVHLFGAFAEVGTFNFTISARDEAGDTPRAFSVVVHATPLPGDDIELEDGSGFILLEDLTGDIQLESA